MGEFVFLDGALGTMLSPWLEPGQPPELLNLLAPEEVETVQRQYVAAGSEILYANTFGANEKKLAGTGKTVEEVVSAGVAIARRAAGKRAKVALDIGPIGQMLAPLGTLSFEDAYAIYRRIILAGNHADLIVLETQTDLYEVKAGLLAAKEASSLPVFVTMTFEEGGRTFTGCTVEAMGIVCQGLGADACGVNCSLGPRQLYPIVEALGRVTDLPLIVKANAGLPDPESGSYGMTAASFAAQMEPFAGLGVRYLGGCCGTTPEFIKILRQKMMRTVPTKRTVERRSRVCTATEVLTLDGPQVVGERLNPTGKKQLRQALQEGNLDVLLTLADQQAQAGAAILDVNVGCPEVDERTVLPQVVRELQSTLSLPLQIDTTDQMALEAALRVYNGKPIVNSVSGEQQRLEMILPLVKKYGAAVIGLTMDEKGLPKTAEERLAIARRILKAALAEGIPKEDVYIDCLTLTASAQQDSVPETLRAIGLVREKLGLKTVLGVSNVSFGLPRRTLLNGTFLAMALQAGLDLAIVNPNVPESMDTIRAFRVLGGMDRDSRDYLATYGGVQEAPVAVPSAAADPAALSAAVCRGIRDEAVRCTQTLLEHRKPMEIVNSILIPALDTVGDQYEAGTLFLPQLLRASDAACGAFDEVRGAMASDGGAEKGKILVATVKGDIHDIGKNIVKTILQNYGYRVLDLGRDVPPEKVVETAVREDIRLIGLSALMTTTLRSMEETISQLRKSGHPCKIWVGGAVVTADYAKKIGADYYAKDAKASVDLAKKELS